MKRTRCYICDSNNYRLIIQKSKYDIVKCNNCNFVFVKPIPLKKELDSYYQKFDYKDIHSSERVIRSDAKRSLRKIGENISSKGTILDVGCGRGYFLDEARKLGWSGYGVDVSRVVTEYAKNKLHLSVFRSDIFSFNPKRVFGLVTLNQVIEHFVNPERLLNKCSEFLTSGGLLYIATPNIESISAKVLKDNFDHYIPPEHVSYFSQHTLTNLLEKLGFKILYVGSWGYPADLGGIVKTLLLRGSQAKQTQKFLNQNSNSATNSLVHFDIKRIKSFLFDRIFCQMFYKVLNFDSWGTNLEILAQKL